MSKYIVILSLIILSGCASTARGTFYNCDPSSANSERLSAGKVPEFTCDKKGFFNWLGNLL